MMHLHQVQIPVYDAPASSSNYFIDKRMIYQNILHSYSLLNLIFILFLTLEKVRTLKYCYQPAGDLKIITGVNNSVYYITPGKPC